MVRRTPKYDLVQIQDFVQGGAYVITRAAFEGASTLYLDEDDVIACVALLTHSDFYKSMESRKRPGTFQDVYRPRYQGFRIYLKVQQSREGAVIISFKRDDRG